MEYAAGGQNCREYLNRMYENSIEMPGDALVYGPRPEAYLDRMSENLMMLSCLTCSASSIILSKSYANSASARAELTASKSKALSSPAMRNFSLAASLASHNACAAAPRASQSRKKSSRICEKNQKSRIQRDQLAMHESSQSGK